MSGTRFLLDTNFAIGLLRSDATAIELQQRLGVPTDGNMLSQISRIELLGYPRMIASDELQIRKFVSFCNVLPIDDAIEAKTIDLRRATSLKLPDAIIAATALVHDLALVTLDQRLGQVVRDWVEA